MDLYTRVFDFFWKLFALLAKVLIEFRFVQRSRYAPFVLGACVGRWSERVPSTDEDRAQIETALRWSEYQPSLADGDYWITLSSPDAEVTDRDRRGADFQPECLPASHSQTTR